MSISHHELELEKMLGLNRKFNRVAYIFFIILREYNINRLIMLALFII